MNRKLTFSIMLIVVIAVSGGIYFLRGTNEKSTQSLNSKDTMYNSIPFLIYDFNSFKFYQVKYDMKKQTVEIDNKPIIKFNNGDDCTGILWNGRENLYVKKDKVSTDSPKINVKYKDDREILKANGIIYSVYGNQNGVTIEKNHKGNISKLNVDITKENSEATLFQPMLIFQDNNTIKVLVHYYHPIENNGMASGLYIIEIEGSSIKFNKVDMQGQCCINYVVRPVVIGKDIYVNTYDGLGKISISSMKYEEVSIFQKLKSTARANMNINGMEDFFNDQPQIGIYDDILLISYGATGKTYIWGLSNEKILFEMQLINGKIITNNKEFQIPEGKFNIVLPNSSLE